MTEQMQADGWLTGVVKRNRQGKRAGVFSVCSAHPTVLRPAMKQAIAHDSMLLIESTSNQVNQFGGYTGMRPADFRTYVTSIAHQTGLDPGRIVLGGDHLGPYPWRSEPSGAAMEKACELVRECVLAGYKKIHLDASMACGDDQGERLSDEVIAERAARMCKVAEEAVGSRESSEVVYVIGTEVPVPGGEQLANHAPSVTRVEDMQVTLEIARKAFHAHGLNDTWDRVVGLVVQPGVEFGDAKVFDYDRSNARDLTQALPKSPELVYEAHSTDYQTASALKELVEDHFAILKVGPWLTFAFREAVFALSAAERDWLGGCAGVTMSRVRDALEAAMLRNPAHWKAYYAGNEAEVKFARMYSFSDRCRYYWLEPDVQRELEVLFRNLSREKIPLTLISQYLPEQFETVRDGRLQAAPEELVEDRIRRVLKVYGAACAE